MTDIEIERVYGRCRRKHAASDYATHLQVSESKHRKKGNVDCRISAKYCVEAVF